MQAATCNVVPDRQEGTSLPLFAVTLLVLLFMAGMAIDFATLYVARSEAQRAADAAALAGAQRFALTGCITSGTCSTAQADATAAAQAAAAQNKVGGQAASVQSGDVTFPSSGSQFDPLVQVKVVRSQGRSNGLPTYFMRVFGSRWATLDLSATATAEAFNPIGSNSLGSGCVKPWIVANCDPITTHTSTPKNTLCTGGPFATFVNPTTGLPSNPGAYPSGVKGELLVLKPGDPHAAAASSQYYPIHVPEGPTSSICPPGAATGNGGGALYERNIECCSTAWIGCGQTTAAPETGNLVGPTKHGVDLLINEGNNGGEDSFNPTTFAITGGANNPNPALVGKTVTSSSSVCTVPIYDGAQLCSGQGQTCGNTVNIVGFMTMFIKDETNPQGTVEAYVLNVGGCGTATGGGTPGSTPGNTPSFVPVRLVQNP